mmetsp:Transcript_1662/g.5375  ORF Transcript_1662/g.5375 Transcript_1662/m.5375 type:complete len:213 (-) Transcript_1662:531-1169(-)
MSPSTPRTGWAPPRARGSACATTRWLNWAQSTSAPPTAVRHRGAGRTWPPSGAPTLRSSWPRSSRPARRPSATRPAAGARAVSRKAPSRPVPPRPSLPREAAPSPRPRSPAFPHRRPASPCPSPPPPLRSSGRPSENGRPPPRPMRMGGPRAAAGGSGRPRAQCPPSCWPSSPGWAPGIARPSERGRRGSAWAPRRATRGPQRAAGPGGAKG